MFHTINLYRTSKISEIRINFMTKKLQKITSSFKGPKVPLLNFSKIKKYPSS